MAIVLKQWGQLAMILRTSLVTFSPASRLIEEGRVARMYILPSSRCGRNSMPSERTPTTARPSISTAPPIVTILLRSAKDAAGS